MLVSYVFCISTAFEHKEGTVPPFSTRKKLFFFFTNARIIRSNMNIRENSYDNNKFCVYLYRTNKFYHKCDKLLRVEIKFNVII